MNKIKVKKGDIIQRSGDLNTNIYFVESGLLRSYTIDEKGKEHIFMFAPEDWIVSDNMPPESPCGLFIDAIEDSELTVRKKGPLADSELDPEIDKLIKRLGVLQQRIIMLMSSSVLERYEHFVDTYPQIVQRVPQKMIASYLGITPEALSKVKRQRML